MTDAVVFQRYSRVGPACAGVEAGTHHYLSNEVRRPRVRGGRGADTVIIAVHSASAPRARG